MGVPVGVFIACVVGSLLLSMPVHWLLMGIGAVDRPNARSSHSAAIARGGGIALLLAIAVGLASVHSPGAGEAWLLVVAAWGIGIISFIDDLKSVGARARFSIHVLGAVFVCFAVLSVGGVSANQRFGATALLVAGFLLWITGYTNAFNFMDGINGIAAGQAAVAALGMAMIGGLRLGDFSSFPVLLSLAVAGAALGFLPYNFPKARMFLGDVGSAPLGFVLAVLVLWLAKTVGWDLLIPLFLLHANFVFDTGFTFLRRVMRGERWYEAHREHFYQRLVRSGKSHTFVTGLEMGLQMVVIMLMVFYLFVPAAIRIILVSSVLVIWSAFFLYCERCFQAFQRRARVPSDPCISRPDLIDHTA